MQRSANSASTSAASGSGGSRSSDDPVAPADTAISLKAAGRSRRCVKWGFFLHCPPASSRPGCNRWFPSSSFHMNEFLISLSPAALAAFFSGPTRSTRGCRILLMPVRSPRATSVFEDLLRRPDALGGMETVQVVFVKSYSASRQGIFACSTSRTALVFRCHISSPALL